MKCPFGPKQAHPAQLTYTPDDVRRLWDTGVKFSTDANARPHKREPPTPVEVKILESGEGALKEMWEAPICLMTKRLLAGLREAGVANIDDYEATLLDLNTGKAHDNYVAFNIVGIVAATDHAKSVYEADIHWFDKLALDESAAREALLFRLKESTFRILVHEKVKDHLQAAGFDTLQFIDPDKLTNQ
ncbi:hypothetical protein NHH03_05130 [Stieleria sp. TO1_6]|uniref:imm11 family protein n=1 Tax=Stieleria tagensis TaxID=2956795 RepID=UPI00209AD7E2|nr:DUF1629 domain-containing protein [Stieleria tagensis]MCO8121112.1 hypothetical protein [Stieleria tagensis]